VARAVKHEILCQADLTFEFGKPATDAVRDDGLTLTASLGGWENPVVALLCPLDLLFSTSLFWRLGVSYSLAPQLRFVLFEVAAMRQRSPQYLVFRRVSC
jgi:hypothetical protein